mmetsp:Transcript_3086/g.11196  ORF Transcript_3086/g.11196 Transcript_3086/m.11196 type:complete len:170 (+) Transcript_3086:565-1074(+)
MARKARPNARKRYKRAVAKAEAAEAAAEEARVKTAFLSHEPPPEDRRPRLRATFTGGGRVMRPGGGAVHAAAIATAQRAVAAGAAVCRHQGLDLYLWAPVGSYSQVELNLEGGGREGPRPDMSVWARGRPVAAVELRHTSALTAEKADTLRRAGVFVIEIDALTREMID